MKKKTKWKKFVLLGTVLVIIIYLIFNWQYILGWLLFAGADDYSRKKLFKENYENFVCIKDMIIEYADEATYTSEGYRVYTHEGESSINYSADQRDEQTEKQNQAIDAIDKAFKEDELRCWEYDGETVRVHDIYQSYRFIYYIDGKPSIFDWGKTNLGKGWYYLDE